jgi:hypothetical protein
VQKYCTLFEKENGGVVMNPDNEHYEVPKKTSATGYRMGQAVAVLIGLCTMAIIIALTVKIIQWLL